MCGVVRYVWQMHIKCLIVTLTCLQYRDMKQGTLSCSDSFPYVTCLSIRKSFFVFFGEKHFSSLHFAWSSAGLNSCILKQGQSDVNFHVASCTLLLQTISTRTHVCNPLRVHQHACCPYTCTTSSICVHTMSLRRWACLCFTSLWHACADLVMFLSCRVQSLITFWWHSLITFCCRFHRFCLRR